MGRSRGKSIGATVTMTLAIGYKRIRYGSNEGAMLDEEIVEFCNIMSM